MKSITNVRKINKKRCIASFVSCIILVTIANIAIWINLSNALNSGYQNMGLKTFKMFTTLSNLILSIGAMLAIPYQIEGLKKTNYHLPRWIVYFLYAGVTGVSVTFVTAITLISISEGFSNSMLKGMNLFLHTINPITALLLFTIVNDDHHLSIKSIFIAFIPEFIYSITYIILVFIIGEANGGWSDHYKFNEFVPWPITLIVMYAMSFGIALLIRIIHNYVHKKRKQAFINYYQNSPDIKADTIEEAIKNLAIQNRKDKISGEVIIPLRSIKMMLPVYQTDKSLKELFKIYIDNNIE